MWMPTLLIFGDLGNGNDRTVAMLQDEIQSERSDFAIHLGDFAYNLEVSSKTDQKPFSYLFSLYYYSSTPTARSVTPSSATSRGWPATAPTR